MIEFLRPTLEFSILIPGTLLCLFPMKGKTKVPEPWIYLVISCLVAFVVCLCGLICYFMNWPTVYLQPVSLISIGTIYCKSLTIKCIRPINLFLCMCAFFSFIMGICSAFNVGYFDYTEGLWLTIQGGLLYFSIGWIFALLFWYPIRVSTPIFMGDENIFPIWNSFWVLPLVVIIANTYFAPHPSNVYIEDHIMLDYVVRSMIILVLMAILYYFFYRLIKNTLTNHKLQRENEFLHMQSAQYDSLKGIIAEIRLARHDIRHHFNVLSTLMESNQWEQAQDYLNQAMESIPSDNLSICNNSAVNAVACHYNTLCRIRNIPIEYKLSLPEKLPVSEMEICVILSNLLENAMEASMQTAQERRKITVNARLHGDILVLLSVENPYDKAVIEKEGIFRSTKRNGEGIGIQSIQHIAKNSGGYCNFTYDNNIFRAHVMLRGKEKKT